MNRLKKMKDSSIDSSDIPEIDDKFWEDAEVIFPSKKIYLSIRLDDDIIEWFKQFGRKPMMHPRPLFTVLWLLISAHVVHAQDILPFPPVPMAGKAAPRLQDSEMKWPEQPQRLPADAQQSR
jgi:hypothetical protein